MHIAMIGAAAFILFLLMGGLFIAAVVLEQRTRARMAGAPLPAQGAPTKDAEAAEAPKAMAAAAGR